jgi:LAO/AO transport system kinase
VAAAADTTLVLLAPGMGDGIQAAKAGILEIGDIFIVNKADRDGAQSTARDLRQMVNLASEDRAHAWVPPVLTAVASTGHGIDEVVTAIAEHRAWALEVGELDRRRIERAREEILDTVIAMLRAELAIDPQADLLESLAADVATGHVDVHSAAESVWKRRFH